MLYNLQRRYSAGEGISVCLLLLLLLCTDCLALFAFHTHSECNRQCAGNGRQVHKRGQRSVWLHHVFALQPGKGGQATCSNTVNTQVEEGRGHNGSSSAFCTDRALSPIHCLFAASTATQLLYSAHRWWPPIQLLQLLPACLLKQHPSFSPASLAPPGTWYCRTGQRDKQCAGCSSALRAGGCGRMNQRATPSRLCWRSHAGAAVMLRLLSSAVARVEVVLLMDCPLLVAVASTWMAAAWESYSPPAASTL